MSGFPPGYPGDASMYRPRSSLPPQQPRSQRPRPPAHLAFYSRPGTLAPKQPAPRTRRSTSDLPRSNTEPLQAAGYEPIGRRAMTRSAPMTRGFAASSARASVGGMSGGAALLGSALGPPQSNPLQHQPAAIQPPLPLPPSHPSIQDVVAPSLAATIVNPNNNWATVPPVEQKRRERATQRLRNQQGTWGGPGMGASLERVVGIPSVGGGGVGSRPGLAPLPGSGVVVGGGGAGALRHDPWRGPSLPLSPPPHQALPPSPSALAAASSRAPSAASTGHSPNHYQQQQLQQQRAGLLSPDTDSIIDVGVAEHANPRWRESMEDAHVVLPGFAGAKKGGYFAVYDGHGGRGTVDYVQEHLHVNLERELAAKEPPDALYSAFLNTDKAMARGRPYRESGTTAAGALILPSKNRKGGRDLFVANVGDARAVMAQRTPNGVTAVRLTRDHNPTTPREINRVHKEGGRVMFGRVNGMLAVSRALGDHSLKHCGVSAVPHQTQLPLTQDHKFMIVGCDGLWDVMSDQEAVGAVDGMSDARQMAQKLVDMAMQRGTTDNVSVMAIRLRPN